MKMKQISIIFVLLLMLCHVNSVKAFYSMSLKPGEISTNEEGYKLRVVLKMKWGDSKDRISIEKKGDKKYGPDLFAVDDSNNIYFNDPGKKRLVKYSPSGEITFSDNKAEIAGVFGDGKIINKRGYIYDAKREFLYNINLPISNNNIRKVFQNTEGVFIIYDNGQYLEIKQNEIEDLLRGGKKSLFSKKENEQKILNGIPSGYSGFIYSLTDLVTKGKINILEKDKIIKTISITDTYKPDEEKPDIHSILGDDEKGNIYILSGDDDSSGRRVRKMMKYDKNGKLLLYTRSFNNWSELEMNSENIFAVDKKGNIYQLCSFEKGVSIMCWENNKKE